MNDIADKILALIGLGSAFALPILVGFWLFCPKNRREPEPETEVSVTLTKRSMSVFIVED